VPGTPRSRWLAWLAALALATVAGCPPPGDDDDAGDDDGADDDTGDDDSGDDDTADDDTGDDDTIEPLVCPEGGKPQTLGTVEHGEIDETSGIAESRDQPGVLWVHNDSGDGPVLYALTTDGVHLGEYTVADVPSWDWEDLALGRDPKSGKSMLYAADIGDNNQVRSEVYVIRVAEPDVSPEQKPVEEELEGTVMTLTYPGGEAFNAEILLADPLTDDLFIVTKDGGGYTRVFRKPPPHVADQEAEVELVAELDFWQAPLAGGSTTGGDISPLGQWVVIRTYGTTAYVWLWDRALSLAEALAADPCTVELPGEQQGEAICFAADSRGLYTISEGVSQPVHHVPLTVAP